MKETPVELKGRTALVTAHDIAEVVAFLCSDAGRLVSGSTIRLLYFP